MSSSMTERERYTTRGGLFRLTGDYRQCVKEYSELLASYPADVAAHNNLAICLANLREFSKAFDEVRKVVAILPNRALYRVNLASFANFSSDFRHGRTRGAEGRRAGRQRADRAGLRAGGTGPAGTGRANLRVGGKISDYGASLGTSGLADLASIEGRFADAVRILEEGVAQDLKFKRPDWAAAKLAALAHTELRRRRPRAAIAAAEKALMNNAGPERPVHGALAPSSRPATSTRRARSSTAMASEHPRRASGLREDCRG